MNPADRLPVATHLRLIAVMSLVVVPHVSHLPGWALALSALVALWSAAGIKRHWPLPSRTIKVLLVAIAFAGTIISYGRVIGQTAGVTLLVVMLALKLTELNSHRDRMFLVMLGYFLLITHFLFSQDIEMLPFMFVAAIGVTAVLAEINHPNGELAPGVSLRHAASLILQAVPVMLILFLLFPRIPGPLWGLPSDAGAGRTGLSDSMSPGAISQLSQSDEVAFRVRFNGPPPPRQQRYWRGPAFWHFDGFTWSPGFKPAIVRDGQFEPPDLIPLGEPIEYDVVLEPHRQNWLFALDMPATIPVNSSFSPERQLLSDEPVRERIRYPALSYPEYLLEPEISPMSRRLATQLPPASNARTLALGREWQQSGLDSQGIVNRALRMFREQPFVYTLQPPRLGRDSVDEFLFETRRGFCEHYASAFTMLMRAAGVPARVMTGYQGGDMNDLGDYLIVRQSDAHAWTEVWLEGRGWVRVDPTAAVAPQRIELGLGGALPAGEPVPGIARPDASWLKDARLRWDMVNARWNEWVLAYGPELQQRFLSALGLPDWQRMLIALTVLIVGFLSLLGGWLLWQARPAAIVDPLARHWQNFCRKMARAGIEKTPDEGPLDFLQRIQQSRPDLAARVAPIARQYMQLRYLGTGNESDADSLKRQIRALKIS